MPPPWPSAAIETARQAAERRVAEQSAYSEPPAACRGAGDAAGGRSTRPATTAISVHPGDRVVLIVENDLAFARVLLDTAREKGFKGIVTTQGATALSLVSELRPSRSCSTSSCPTSRAGACSRA